MVTISQIKELKTMAVTAKDIAEKLGISPAAVSLAMNGKPGVSIATREKILAEAVRVGYAKQTESTPISAQNIRYVIFLDGGATVKETSFYSIVLQGIESKAKAFGYNVLISYFDANGDWDEQITSICKDVAGLIVLATEIENRHIRKAIEHGLGKQPIPVVLVDNATSMVDVDCVVTDNLGGAYHAVMYLLNKNHPDVGYLRSKSRIDSFNERESGVRKARWKFGISEHTPLQCINVGISSEDAFYDMGKWLDNGGKPLSAFFADNDIIAAACIRAFKSRGYRIPEDVSIVGFDDMPVCTMVDPPLTTIRVMKSLMGMTSMDMLYQRIQDGTHALSDARVGVLRTTISTHLVERESSISYHSEV